MSEKLKGKNETVERRSQLESLKEHIVNSKANCLGAPEFEKETWQKRFVEVAKEYCRVVGIEEKVYWDEERALGGIETFGKLLASLSEDNSGALRHDYRMHHTEMKDRARECYLYYSEEAENLAARRHEAERRFIEGVSLGGGGIG